MAEAKRPDPRSPTAAEIFEGGTIHLDGNDSPNNALITFKGRSYLVPLRHDCSGPQNPDAQPPPLKQQFYFWRGEAYCSACWSHMEVIEADAALSTADQLKCAGCYAFLNYL